MLDTIFSLNTLWWLMLFLYIPASLALVLIVLLQKGKGVGFAGAFGAGPGGDAVFGPRSSKSLPQKITYAMASIFMLLALLMSMLSGQRGSRPAPSLVEDTGVVPTSTSPMGTLDALFSDAPVSSPEAPAAAVEDAEGTTAPATDTGAPVTESEIPVDDAAPVEAPVEDAAPAVETPTEEEAPAAETPAAQ